MLKNYINRMLHSEASAKPPAESGNSARDDIKEYLKYLDGVIREIGKEEGYFLNKAKLKEYYTYQRIGFYFDLLALIDRLIGVRDKEICDMASGGGVLSSILYRRYQKTITSIDNLKCGVEFGKLHTPSAVWIRDNMLNLHGQYDIVFACEVLEHVVDPKKVLDGIISKSRPGGNVVITVPDGRIDDLEAGVYSTEMEAYSGHINFWSRESFGYFFKEYDPDIYYLEGRGDRKSSKLCAVIRNR